MITNAEKDVLIAYINEKNERINQLEVELTETKKRILARSSGPIGMPKRIAETDFSFYHMETDEEFSQWGKPHAEVID